MKLKALILTLLLLLPFALTEGAQRRYIKLLKTNQLNSVEYMSNQATGGVGTAANPWTGWESACVEGDICYFPAGYYSTATGLSIGIAAQNVPSETAVIRDGPEQSIIEVTADVTALRIFGSGASAPDLVEGVVVSGLGFQSTVDLTGPLVQFEEFETQWTVEDIHLRNPTAGINIAKGIYFLNCQMGSVRNVLVRSYSANNDSDFDIGIHLHSDDGIQRGNTQFHGGQVANGQVGIQITSSGGLLNNISFYGTKVMNSVASPTSDVDGSIGFDFQGGLADGALLANVHVERYEQCVKADGTDNLTIVGGIFSQCADDADADGAAIELVNASQGTLILAPRINTAYDGVVIPAAAVQSTYYLQGRFDSITNSHFIDGSTVNDGFFYQDGADLTIRALVFEGTEDAFETTLVATDPTTPDKTVTIPNTTGTIMVASTAVDAICGSVAIDPGSIATVADIQASGTATNVVANDACICEPRDRWQSAGAEDDLIQRRCFGGTDTINVEIYNPTGGALDPASETVDYCCFSK